MRSGYYFCYGFYPARKNNGEEWAYVEAVDGTVGWVRKKYVTGIP
ncbi:MAG: hypothetical protein AAGU27_16475 [Dehalobacterium sp.]